MRFTYRAILALFLMASCNGSSIPPQNNTANLSDDNYIEDTIIQKVFAIDSVRERAEYVLKNSNGKRKLSATIYGPPSDSLDYYLIKVTEDNGTAYHTHFNYKVNKKTLQISSIEN